MKNYIIVLIMLLILKASVVAQNVGIGSSQFTPSSTLEIRSTNNTAGTYGFKLLNSSSANLLFVQNNGNVGMGTSTTNTMLHLDDQSNTGPQITLSAPTNGTPGIVFRPYQTAAQWSNPAQALLSVTDNNYSANIRFWTKVPGALGNALAERMTIQNDGNLGIGSATPARKIDIVGDGKISGTLYGTSYNQDMVALSDLNWTFGGYNSGSNYWMQSTYWDTGDNLRGFRIFNKNASDVVFSTNKTYSLFPFGNLGIGTSVPSAKLVVNNNTVGITPVAGTVVHVVGSDAGSSVILLDGITNSAWFRGRLALGTAATPTSLVNGNFMSTLAGRGYLGTAGYSTQDLGRVAIVAEENFSNTSAKSGILFETTAATTIVSTEKMRLNGDGNLGIGTNSPSGVLHVVSSTAGRNLMLMEAYTNTSPNGAGVWGRKGRGTSSAPLDLAAGDEITKLLGSGYFSSGFKWTGGVWNSVSSPATNDAGLDGGTLQSDWTIGFGAGYASAPSRNITLKYSGNVGLGVALPVNKLDVEGGAAIGATYSGTNTAPTNGLLVEGNVGVGTTTAAAKLHVAGDGAAIFAGYNILQTARFKTNANGAIILDGGQTGATQYLRGIYWGFGSEDFGLTRFRIDQGVAPINDFYISTAGNVHIGGSTPGSKFDVGANGDGTVARANAWNTFSDARWKKDVTPITNGLSLVQSLQGVNYTWKANDKKDFGFIAQEVEKILPLAVHTDDKGYKSVDYARITSVLVEAVKEQQKKIESQQKAIISMESTNDNQQKIIEELKSTNQILKAANTQQENRLIKIEQQLSEIKGNTIQTKK